MKDKEKNISLIIDSLKEGDESAFKYIYENHKKALFAFVNSYTKSTPLTKDIVQDTFIKLWTARETLEEDSSVVSFLYRTAYNTFIDSYRKKKTERSTLDGWLHKRLLQLGKDDNDEVKNRKIKLMQKAIEKLPPRCKEVFVMSKFDELKYVEIAEQLNISVKTVEAQMGKAFSIIRKEVKDKGLLNLFLHFMKRPRQKLSILFH